MAKAALLDVLEKTIGKYVVNLDAESLNVAVWSGKIKLNTLQLDCEAVNAELSRQAAVTGQPSIPFQVIAGEFGSFEVDVPWANLMSRPVVLRASDLQVTVEPYNRAASTLLRARSNRSHDQNTEEERALQIQKDRIKSLQSADEYRKQANRFRNLAVQDLETQSSENQGFVANLVRRILENLQIEITRVHVEVQASNAYAAGLEIDSLSLTSTDENGVQTFVDRSKSGEALYKSLKIQGLGVYLDEVNPQKVVRLRSINEDDAAEAVEHSYLLVPLSFEAKLRQDDSNICLEYPKYLLESELSSLSVHLSKPQLELVHTIRDQIKSSAATPLFPEYRPLRRISRETAVEWWKYAVRCVGRMNGRRSWAEFFAAFQFRKAYIPLYKRHVHHATCPWLEPLTTLEVFQMEDIEAERSISVDGIMAWRTMADAQVAKEKEKDAANKKAKCDAAPKGVFTSLFGGSGSKSPTATQDQSGPVDDDPPIALTTSELQELEAMTIDAAENMELSSDSRLCDINFVMGSLQIELASYHDRKLASLRMGKVATSFSAHKDGSYVFDLSLSSLGVKDLSTPDSLFPTILRNQLDNDEDKAFQIEVSKNRKGDQKIAVKLNTFETVVVPNLIVEMKRMFASTPRPTASYSKSNANGFLAQSLSGSVDLFFDADGGPTSLEASGTHQQQETKDAEVAPSQAVDDISSALMEAWKTKTESDVMWSIDLDLRAPIVVIPENAVEPRSNVIVFDMGHSRFKYGNDVLDGSSNVADWFKSNQRGDDEKEQHDNGFIGISSLTFTVGKAAFWKRIVRKQEDGTSNPQSLEAILEPITVSLDLGVETTVDVVPRICCFGVVPSICLSLSPGQLTRMLKVINGFQRTLNQESPMGEEIMSSERDDNDSSSVSSSGRKKSSLKFASKLTEALTGALEDEAKPQLQFFAGVELKRLSVKAVSDSGHGIEAHLVSVAVTTSRYTDGSSQSNLCMGWFWILDRCENSSPRKQRLFAHSTLPRPATEYAASNNYEIMQELKDKGVFDTQFSGSADLADVTLRQAAPEQCVSTASVATGSVCTEWQKKVSFVLDAKFTSLYITWNPGAVTAIVTLFKRFADSIEFSKIHEPDAMILSSPTQFVRRRKYSSDSSQIKKQKTKPPGSSAFLINASMDGLYLSLNSARDDLPLFLGNMCDTNVSVIGHSTDMEVHLTIGDLQVATPPMGRTLPGYRTVLGLASGRSDSLLSVSFYSGVGAVANVTCENLNLADHEAFGDIELSPMRIVYVQAQVLALVEYATAGILGSLTAQAASSAARAAAELAAPATLKKLFRVKATGLELMFPQAAHCEKYLAASVGTTTVDFTSLPNTSSHVDVGLSDMMIRDNTSETLLVDPVQMNVITVLPALGVGTQHEQAISVALDISKAHFVLAKHHYAQILDSLEFNISEVDLLVRDGSCLLGDYSENADDVSPTDDDSSAPLRMTHGGAEFVDNPRRVYLDVKVQELVFTMCGADVSSPVVRVSAVNSETSFRTFPDENGRMAVLVTLLDLVCEDVRQKTSDRQYRTLIHQPEATTKQAKPKDVCVVSYEAQGDGNSAVVLTIGSPRITFIPDAITDILDFVSVDRPSRPQPANAEIEEDTEYHDIVAVNSCGDEHGFETSVVTQPGSSEMNTLTFELKTAKCSVLLVDLGSDALLTKSGETLSSSAVSETIVVGGLFHSKLLLQSERATGNTVNLNTEVHVDELEVFTAFGLGLQNPVQLLDPTQVSTYLSKRSDEGIRDILDVRCAVIAPIDITVSMRNIALINAILTSFGDSFDSESAPPESLVFTEEDARKVEVLDQALGDNESERSISVREFSKEESSRIEGTPIADQSTNDNTQISLKITTTETKLTVVNDLQGLDEALLRIALRNFIANAHTQQNVRYKSDSTPFNSFDFSVHTSILADYFDAHSRCWKSLLLLPWEISSKGSRGLNRRIQTERPSTSIDIESLPCHLSFSEQFLMNLASAQRMWSIYSAASESALESLDESASKSLRKSLAAGAARSFISSLPYAIENISGIGLKFVVFSEKEQHRSCSSGSIEYFQFEHPPGEGAGGKRLYGKDLVVEKRMELLIGSEKIELRDLDSLLGRQSTAHFLADGAVLVTKVVKDTKTTVIRVTSGVSIENHSSLPFSVFAKDLSGEETEIGRCNALHSGAGQSAGHSKITRDGNLSKSSHRFGLPLSVLRSFQADWISKRASSLALSFCPDVHCPHPGWALHGLLVLEVASHTLRVGQPSRYDLICQPFQRSSAPQGVKAPRDLFPFMARVTVETRMAQGNFPLIDISIEPRAIITNKIPISIAVKTPMPQVFATHAKAPSEASEETEFTLAFNEHMEVFTSGPSIAVLVKLADSPISGTVTDWMDGGWIDLSLVPEFRVHEPLMCRFPFMRRSADEPSAGAGRGCDFCIVEGTVGLSQLGNDEKDSQKPQNNERNPSRLAIPDEEAGSFYITVCNYAIDHTGDILFEQVSTEASSRVKRSDLNRIPPSPPLGTYSTVFHNGRISLLPNSDCSIRLLHLTMEGEDGVRRSSPFRVDDVSVCDGGFDSTPLFWEDGTASGFFAYRQLVGSHQSEVHFIPEYIIFNGSEKYCACVHLPGGDVVTLEPGGIAPLRIQDPNHAEIVVEYPEVGGRTRPLRVDTHGLRMTVLRSLEGRSVGRFAVQTVVGARDSRWVAKLGEVKFGSMEASSSDSSIFKNDFVRFRIKWSELRMTLSEARPQDEPLKQTQDMTSPRNRQLSRAETWVEARERRKQGSTSSFKFGEDHGRAVCTILLHRFTVDWQRVFKDDATIAKQAKGKEALESPQRAQLSVIVHQVRIQDESRHTPFPVVFDSTSQTTSFFDLCVRIRGDMDMTLMKIDLIDIKVAHVNGITEKIFISTTEDFVWSALDLADRIATAAGEFSSVKMKLDWDDEHGGYTVAIQDAETNTLIERETKYVPPKSDRIYSIQRARISPFSLVVSFKRNPQVSRYTLAKGVRGSGLMNYFSRQLKFTVDKAELKFQKYEVADVKGPPDRIIELISTVYAQRMKSKVITILTSASFQDWKYLASRDDGNDEYMEGDFLRATGNLAGRSVNFVLKKASNRVGGGVSTVANSIGDGIESATDAMGVRALGAGVNSLVSGVGDGVGDTISGVGTGAGKIMKGAGKGVGKVIGGFAGGAAQMGKGIGKGIVTGDGSAVSTGFVQGAQSIGTGVGQGVESVVTGASEGVLTVGHGLLSGVKNVGRGIGGAFVGKKTPRKPPPGPKP